MLESRVARGKTPTSAQRKLLRTVLRVSKARIQEVLSLTEKARSNVMLLADVLDVGHARSEIRQPTME